MKLSIIIVNFNVKYFLEQCLCSVKKAIEKIDAEVFVVDNNSSDGSIDYLKSRFSFVQFIINSENTGFSKANNAALAIARGRYILFLNPDTIVGEDCFEICISFLESDSGTGALGVKMIDGSGNYLKESKRGFPSPWVSFCKLSGLTALFPRSKLFAKYYLGNLSENENQIIDSISGAFFFARKDVLEKVGGFDEQFFMYAEDIDLSYRIRQAGYKNYFLFESTIIHFKGESTRKDFRYIKQFYRAMSLFSRKYFRGNSSTLFSFFIDFAISARRAIAFIGTLFNRKKIPVQNVNQKIFLLGDESDFHKLEDVFFSKGKTFTKNERDADELIFCESKDFPFKKIIRTVQQSNKKKLFMFHAFSSSSVISSSKKNISGSVFQLNS